ncbi:unnamed protein product [Spodoptera exigua]|nr:unnamed protein product [Spodoptera exigua]
MFPNLTVLQIALIALTTISCEVTRDKRGRRKNDEPDKSLWKKEYEEELTDAILSGRKQENYTRAAQGGPSTENDAVIEKLMESITSSEKYLKKVDSIEFRLNRLDIEVHEKTNAIIKLLNEITKTLRSDTCSQKMESALTTMKNDVSSIKFYVEKNPMQRSNAPTEGREYRLDSNLDSRLTFLETHLKTVQAGVESIVSIISEVKNRQYVRTSPVN